MEEKTRAHVIISGKVQGVFFRAETQRAAIGHNVKGWVRNRPDGTVEAVFEGEAENVKAMMAWCRQGPPFSRVIGVEVDYPPFTGEFGDFRIVR